MSALTFTGRHTWFYAVGNTPAVFLTQNMPPGQPADVLMLGCGDVRNILFTAHADNADRLTDITCCDKQPAVLARNVVILTLILDDSDGVRSKEHWDVYYHLHLTDTTRNMVRAQAKKLLELSSSLDTWNASAYGKHIKFCDSASLKDIRELWTLYSAELPNNELSAPELRLYRHFFNISQQKIMSNNPTGFRSTAPACSSAGMSDTFALHKRFWKNGDTDAMDNARASVRANPMFLSPDPSIAVHYGTDPVLGYHLAMAYVPLEQDSRSPVNAGDGNADEEIRQDKIFESARTEFREWSASFRQRAVRSITVRLFRGDAIAFCHVLNHLRIDKGTSPAHIYRDQHLFEPLVLDSVDYGSDGAAPLSFTTIDTSNVADHVGLVNLLVATSPLLSAEPSASLHTETLARPEGALKDSVSDLLCGHLPTVSTLLGLVLTEHCTNTFTSSPADEEIINYVREMSGEGSMKRFYARLAWKRPPRQCLTPPWPAALQRIAFKASDLASILFVIYAKMFEGEKMGSTEAELNAHLARLNITDMGRVQATVRKLSLTPYHRGSFAALLRIVKDRVVVDWDEAMSELVRLIDKDAEADKNIREASKQELYVYMGLLGLHNAEALRVTPFVGPLSTYHHEADVRNWLNAPQLVCLTMTIDMDDLKTFAGACLGSRGLLPLQCVVQSAASGLTSPSGHWRHRFAALQVGFGKLWTTGARFTDDFEVHVLNDPSGWNGKSPFIVSFMVPTRVLLEEPGGALVMLGILPTIDNMSKFRGTFGGDLKIHGTSLGDQNHVFLSRNMPNSSGPMTLCGLADAHVAVPVPAQDSVATISITAARVKAKEGSVQQMVGRLIAHSDELKDLFANAEISVSCESAFHFGVHVEGFAQPLKLSLPTPMAISTFRVGRAQEVGELALTTWPAKASSWTVHPSATYPICFDGRAPVLWNMPYVRLDALPAVKLRDPAKVESLARHATVAGTTRELTPIDDRFDKMGPPEHARSNLKSALIMMFEHFVGLGCQRKHVFRFRYQGEILFIVFAAKLRLDLSNRTLVLDAAVLPVHDEQTQRINELTGGVVPNAFLDIPLGDNEMALWRYVLPAFVERGRTWEHRADCEYVEAGRVPVGPEALEPILCGCGTGVFPEGFVAGVPKWNDVAVRSVRAAFSPVFWCPFVETGPDQTGPAFVAGIGLAKEECLGCGDTIASGTSNKCPQCEEALYCSRKCRREDWKRHKPECRENRKA